MITGFIFIIGLIIGSFLNALIWRLHSGESMMDRSMCPKCRHQLAWFDNVPVISYLVLRGKCRHCGVKISLQYPLVELVTAGLFLLAYQRIGINILDYSYFEIASLFKYWFVISVMIIVFIYDLRWYLILDKITIPASVVLFFSWTIERFYYEELFIATHWYLLVAAIVVGSGFFATQYYVSKGKWLGFGDVKLSLVMAIVLGWPNMLGAIFIAYLLGSFVGVGLILLGKKELGSKLPFGTFLSVATVIMLLYGTSIIEWYSQLIGL